MRSASPSQGHLWASGSDDACVLWRSDHRRRSDVFSGLRNVIIVPQVTAHADPSDTAAISELIARSRFLRLSAQRREFSND